MFLGGEEEKMRNFCKFRLPTLKSLPPFTAKIKNNLKLKTFNDSLFLELNEKPIQETECLLLLNKNTFFVKPEKYDRFSLHEGEVIGFINPDNFNSIKNAQDFQKRPYEKLYHQEIFKRLSKRIEQDYEELVMILHININELNFNFFFRI